MAFDERETAGNVYWIQRNWVCVFKIFVTNTAVGLTSWPTLQTAWKDITPAVRDVQCVHNRPCFHKQYHNFHRACLLLRSSRVFFLLIFFFSHFFTIFQKKKKKKAESRNRVFQASPVGCCKRDALMRKRVRNLCALHKTGVKAVQLLNPKLVF